jgi:hypothetical protein
MPRSLDQRRAVNLLTYDSRELDGWRSGREWHRKSSGGR